VTDQKAGEVTRERAQAALHAIDDELDNEIDSGGWTESKRQNLDTLSDFIQACHQRDQRIAKLEAEVARLRGQRVSVLTADSVRESIIIGCESGEGHEKLWRRIDAVLRAEPPSADLAGDALQIRCWLGDLGDPDFDCGNPHGHQVTLESWARIEAALGRKG